MPLRRAGTVTNAGAWCGPGSAAHRFARATRCAASGARRELLRLRDADLQRADPVDAAFDLVAGRQRRDAGGRAGHDDVASAERDLLRELPDDFRYAPDQ